MKTPASDAENLAASRELTQNMLDGTHLVPTHACRNCGSRALKKGGRLEMSWKHRGCNGSAVVPEITLCLDGCKQTTVRRVPELGTFIWCYGSQDVVIVEGPSYVVKRLPQPLSDVQRAQAKDFLIETAAA